ncbi:S-adenosyl-L-methionine-dependent methyltransferases superfamily protein [Prunus dulcis]|uniref:Trimethylguanosine synthase n=1 Tax=Prunus dulcis TaxID=3755 RepID=A0A4Y1QTU3_PRUDU|nr:S-adenosyl-L-methionine-dependent methyltransferases superfamily protein [Prunus dulcis]
MQCGTLPEDMELTKQMNALGLPVSFLTNKEKRNRKAEGKKKGMRLKHPVTSQGYVVEALESSKVSVGKIVSPVNFDGNTGSSLCCMSMMGQSESSSSDVAADAIKFQSLSVEGDNPASSTEITSDASKEQDRDGILGVVCNDGQDCDSLHGSAVVNDTMKISASTTDLNDGIFSGSCSTDAAISQEPGERLMEHDHLECSLMTLHEAEDAKICEDYVPEKCVSESVSYSTCSEVLDHDGTDSQDNGDVGDWMNTYFDMAPTQGMEHISTVDTTYKSNEMTAQVIDMNVTTDLETTDLCGLSKTESFEEAISDDVSQGQPYCELSGGLELTVDNSMSDTTLPTVSLSRCLEHSVELNESNNTGNDGNASYLSSNVQDLARNNTKQLVADEVYKNDLEPIRAEKTDEPNTIDLYNEPSKINSCEETLEDFEGDDAFQILDMSSLSNTYTEEVSEDFNMHSGTGVPAINEMEMHHDLSVVKRKKKMRRMKIQRKLSNEELLFQGLFKEFSADIGKYWCQRYLLFSRYDDGIKMDEEGWFSVTPEPLARHHAERCGSGIIIDCFTGVGGNSIQFAHISKHVIAIDIDPKKIDYAHHNAAIYGVDDRIDFIKGDFFELAPKLKLSIFLLLQADTVFLSPPWGGPDYAKVKTYDLRMLKPHDGYFLFNTAKEVASRIVMFLPRNVDLNQLAELALSGSRPWSLEVEKNFLTGKLKGITAYFSDMTGRQ